MTLHDVYEFKLESLYNDAVECLNVWTYESNGSVDVTTPMNDIAAALWDKIGSALKAVASNVVVYKSVYVKNLMTLTEGYYGLAPTEDGDRDGDCLPPFNAYSFQFQRQSAITRHGHKRFVGVPESVQHNGVITDGTTLTNLGTLAAALGAPLDDDNGINASAELWPIIYGRYQNGELLTVPIINPVIAVNFTGIGSQNTRKL
jgi:hypothetical protein